MVRLGVGFGADLTHVRFFAGVDARVLREAVFVYESLATSLTNVRLDSGMNAKVLIELRLLDKAFAADAANKWLLSGVKLLVELESNNGRKSSAAEIAQKRPLGVVTGDVCFVGHMTRSRLVKSLEMLLQIRLAVVR